MKQLLFSVIVTTAFASGTNIIYQLSDADYARMPPVYHLDAFNSCFQQIDDIYCTVTFGLKSDEPSDLLTMIYEYSKQSITHFNHSNLRYGLCVTERCRHRYSKNKNIITKVILEECLNEFFIEEYNLKTAVSEYYCKEFKVKNEKLDFDDMCVALIIFALLSIAIVATLMDIFMSTESKKSHHILVNFSIKRNWLHLKSTNVIKSNETEILFKSLHGIKVFLFFMVVFGHSAVPVLLTAKSVEFIEESYNNILPYVFYTGTIIVQTFFVISGMLLVYKIKLYEETKKIDYKLLPMILAKRWLRLTPPYALTIAITSTLFRHIKSGPLWETATGLEVKDCRQRGWLNLLYLNNYIYDAQCLPHTWYLAADMQLFTFGVIMYLIARNSMSRVFALGVAFFIGTLVPLIHTYMQNLEPLLLLSPEPSKMFFGNDPTYNEVYKRGHTNISSYVVGLSLGYLIYSLKRNNFTTENYKKYRIVYWSLLPACLLIMMLGSIFYNDALRPTIYIRLIYATFAKPLFAVIVAILIFGMAFKYEDIYRIIFEWGNWLPPSRLSYNAFIVHFVIMRLYIGTITELIEDNPLIRVLLLLCFITASFIAAIPLWIFVEAPVVGLLKLYTKNATKDERKWTQTMKKVTKFKSKTN